MQITRDKKKLKPLALGDVMVALVNQETTQDRTQLYKQIFTRNYFHQSSQDKIIINQINIRDKLPQFAKQDLTNQELLDFHIRNKTKPDSIQEYEELLEEVDESIKVELEGYSEKLKEGEETIGELMGNLGIVCNDLGSQRKYLAITIDRVNKGYSKIGPKLHKINNIEKVLQITKIWGAAKLPYIISIDVKHPHRYDIKDVLNLIQTAQAIIQEFLPSSKSSSALHKILETLEQKKQQLICNVCELFQNSIINFISIKDYENHYKQYMIISEELNLCKNILTMQGIKAIIQSNSKKMFNDILGKITVLKNVDMLNQQNYTAFYDEIIEEFAIYFRSWHFATKFHIDKETGYENLFLENRRNVFHCLSEVLSNSIKYSNKFISMEYKIKLQLCEKFEDYIEAGIKWMGFSENSILSLKKQVRDKMKKQLQQIFSLYNNLIKNMLAKQLSSSALDRVDNPIKTLVAKDITEFEDIDYLKVARFLSKDLDELRELETQILNRKRSESLTNMIKVKYKSSMAAAPTVQLNMSQILIEMISEYLERSKYLQRQKDIYIEKINEHFQFIIYSLYSVSVRKHISQKLLTDIKEKLKATQEIGIKIGSNDQGPSLKKLNELWKIDQLQRKYELIFDFSVRVGKRYEGIWISGFLDVDKVFESNSDQIIINYIKLQIRLFKDILKILNWVIEVIPESNLNNKNKSLEKMVKLKGIALNLFKIIIENYIELEYTKIVETANSTQKLKWEIKKYNQEVANNYRQYKLKILQAFRNNTLSQVVKAECPSLPQLIFVVRDLEIQNIHKALLQIYGKIEKINDNGRQLLRMDYIEIKKILEGMDLVSSENIWEAWFQRYLEYISERSYRAIIEKIHKTGIVYPPLSWKYHMMWIIGEMSSKQKKQYNSQLNKFYYQYLSQGA